MKKILVLVGNCVEDSQVDFPIKTLLTLGYKVDIASPNKGWVVSLLHQFSNQVIYNILIQEWVINTMFQ